MGRPLPGYAIAAARCRRRRCRGRRDQPRRSTPRPLALMLGYQATTARSAARPATAYRTGDVASRDADGYLTYVGRADDVFKASDYRISPFELESALIEHAAVAEAAVVPAPDPMRLAVPKAYHHPGRRARAGPRDRAVDLPAPARQRSRRSCASGGSNSPSCRNDLGQDPPGRAAAPGSRASQRGRARRARVLGRGFFRAEVGWAALVVMALRVSRGLQNRHSDENRNPYFFRYRMIGVMDLTFSSE